MRTAAAVLAAASLAACSSSSSTTDAPKAVDAKVFKDASPVDAKVFMDAAIPSTVIVGPCTGITPTVTIMTDNANNVFSNTAPSITHGQYVEFTTTGTHNFASQPGAGPASTFRSGPVGAQTVCLQFTAAGMFPFQCDEHAFMGMTGTLTVN